MRMKVRQLRYFLKVAELGSITAAAKELRMTQPALSRQIRAFEDDCGWNLLDRGAKSVRLTRAGRIVEQEGKQMIAEVDQRMMQMRRQIEGGVIRVGYAPSLGGEILKKAIGCFVQRHPTVRVDLLDSTSEEMRTKCLSGEMDLMVGTKIKDDLLEWKVLFQKNFCLAVPKEHTLAKKRVVKGKALDGSKLLILSRYDYPNYFEEVSSYFHALGVNAKIAGEFDGIESMRVALEAGLGIALVAEGATVGEDTKLLKLQPPAKPVQVAVGWRNDRALDPVTAAFVEELKMVGEG